MDEQAQRSVVVAEARSWLLTPYHHQGRVKGAGVDCAQILCAVFEAASVVPHIDLGDYPPDWHLHHSEERYLDWLERVGAHQVQTPAPGDIAVYRFGRCYSHGTIVIEPGLVIHSYLRHGVHYGRETEAPLEGRAVQYWSPWQ